MYRPLFRLLSIAITAAALVAGLGACGQGEPAADPAHVSHNDGANKSNAQQPRDPNRLWCNAHGVYEDECTICHPEIATAQAERDPNRLWCNEHSVYEDECTICHPEIATAQAERDPNRLWCNEHGVYEDECTICHPEISVAATDGPMPFIDLYCKEHDLYERECGICHPELMATLGPGQGLKVRFASSMSAQKAGIRTGYPAHTRARDAVEALGEVGYNANALAAAVPLAGGVVQAVHADVGDSVEAGEVLAEIASPAVADAKSAYLKARAAEAQARAAYERENRLHEREIAAAREVEVARADYQTTQAETARVRQSLLNLGLTEADIAETARTQSPSAYLPVRAPLTGTLVDRKAVVGSAVDTAAPLFTVANLDTMWLRLSVPEDALSAAGPGAAINVTFDALPGHTVEGTLTWVAPQVDASTRMIEARAILPNTDRRLKAGLFGRARIERTQIQAGLSVPRDAVQMVDGAPVVFAKLGDDLFETRLVRLGAEQGPRVEVLEGLASNEEIVVAESFIMKSELLKARLGAGCVH